VRWATFEIFETQCSVFLRDSVLLWSLLCCVLTIAIIVCMTSLFAHYNLLIFGSAVSSTGCVVCSVGVSWLLFVFVKNVIRRPKWFFLKNMKQFFYHSLF